MILNLQRVQTFRLTPKTQDQDLGASIESIEHDQHDNRPGLETCEPVASLLAAAARVPASTRS